MDISKLKRDPEYVLSHLVEVQDTVIAKKECKIHVPARFLTRGLGEVGTTPLVAGFLAIIVDDRYALMNVTALIQIGPSSTNMININDVEYYEYTFNPGAKVITNMNVVKRDTLTYYIFNELIAKANIPWYATLTDVAKLYLTTSKYTAAKLFSSNIIVEMIVSQLARVTKDKTQQFRMVVKDLQKVTAEECAIVPLRSPLYGGTNATSRLMSTYFDNQLMVSIDNPTVKVEPVEANLNI